MKNKKVILGIIAVVLLISCMAVAFFITQGNNDYYTQIDNRWVTEIAPHGAMNYKYTLVAYDEDGKEQDVTFETSRALTDKAFLCLKISPLRGVVTWAEVQYDELPTAVKQQYT